MLYSKNGSIPQEQTDGTDGWIEVPDKPETPEGKEVVWWFPPGWVIRDPRPEPEEGFVWKWNQSSEEWIKYERPSAIAPLVEVQASDAAVTLASADVSALSSADIASLTTDQISALE